MGAKRGVKWRSQLGSCLLPTPNTLPALQEIGGIRETVMRKPMGGINARLLWVCLLSVANSAVSAKGHTHKNAVVLSLLSVFLSY